MGVAVFGRILPGVAIPEAEAQLSGVAAALPRDAADAASALRVQLDPHAGLGRVSNSTTLAIAAFVFAVIGLVLLLACANVACVLISTAITREREMGVRAALGASRSRIVRQLVTESLALGAIAAPVGLMCAWWAMPTIGRMIEAPAGIDLAPDLDVYLFLSADCCHCGTLGVPTFRDGGDLRPHRVEVDEPRAKDRPRHLLQRRAHPAFQGDFIV